MPKICFVPRCTNTSANSNKIFITVPFNEEIRKIWCEAVKRDTIPKPTSGRIYCCEDHFVLKDDCENWVHYKLMQQKLILKKGVVPHKSLSGKDVPKDLSQLTDSTKKRKLENIERASEMSVKKDLFKEPSTSVQLSSPETSPKSKIMQSSSSSSLASSLPSSSQLEESTSDSAEEQFKESYLQKLSCERTFLVVENHSRFYLGLPKDTYFIVKLLETEAAVSHRNILLILKKIRLNDAFYRLALDFGISISTTSKIFGKDVRILASFFKNLICWPDSQRIKENLPIPFRARYWNVQSIIDCFEIQIEQPTNSLHQSLTWSL